MRPAARLALALLGAACLYVSASAGPMSKCDQLFGARNASLEQIRELGVTWCAGPAITWETIEPRRSSRNWGHLDDIVREAGQAKVQLVPALCCYSPWGSSRALVRANTSRRATYQSGYPADERAWRSLVTALVERYDGDGVEDLPGLRQPIKNWQVEREFPRCWADSPADLARYLRLTAAAIKAADSTAVVIAGGIAANTLYACAFVDRALGELLVEGRPVERASLQQNAAYKQQRAVVEALLGTAAAFDVLDLHLYGRCQCIDEVVAWVDGFAGIKAKPKWCLQGGCPVAMFDAEARDVDVANGVIKWYSALALAGIQRGAWTVRPEGGSDTFNETALLTTSSDKRPAYAAYKAALAKLETFTWVKRQPSPANTTFIEYGRPGGNVVVGWAAVPTHVDGSKYHVKRMTAADGRSLPVKTKLDLGLAPIYFE